MAQEHSPTTFAALFNDVSRDPFLVNGGYEAFLAPFQVKENNNATPLVVHQLISAMANQLLPVALVALVNGRLTPLFLPFRRDQVMGVAEHPATDGRMYAFEGELIGTQGYLVELANDSFNLTPCMTIPDVGHVRGLLATSPQLQVADGMAVACEPLTRFCLAAITTQADAGSPITINAPRPPDHHEQANARLDRELKENTTVASWLGAENFARLLKYCGVADKHDLAPLWSTWAKAPAKDRLTIFKGKVANEFFALGAIYEQFTPSLFMLTQITLLKWGMLNPDALEPDVELAQGINRQIDFIQQGGATPSYADAQMLLKAKISLPGLDASVHCILRMLAVYRAILPEGHRLVSFLQQHHSLMNAYDPGWMTYPTYIPQLRGLKGVYHLQWLSLKLTRYFGQLDRNMAEVQVPDAHEIINHIQEQRQWEPNLTETFATRYNLRALLGVHTRVLPSIGSLQSLGATSTMTGSTISGVTFPSQTNPPPADAGITTGASSRVTNEKFNEALFRLYKTNAIKAKTVRDKVKAGTIPPLPTSIHDGTKPMPVPSPVRKTFSTLVTPGNEPGYLDYLEEEFVDMINKGHWIVLPYSTVSHLPGLCISPPGVIPQRDRRPRWIVDYSWWDVNNDTLTLTAMESMQFGHTLNRILREILLANPAFGPVYLIKLDISNGFYHIALAVDDIPKLGMAFPTPTGANPLVAFPLVLPMGWKNSPPIFSTATKTIADLTNARLRTFVHPLPHHLDDMAELVASQPPPPPPPSVTPSLVPRDPSLPASVAPPAYTDVYIDDFVGAAQGSPRGTHGLDNRCRVRRLLLHAVDDVFRPLSSRDDPACREPVSMKKLAAGDCSWGTIKQVLGWIIDLVDMTIALPPHHAAHLLEVLDSFPPTQKRTSPTQWHAALGELRSMALALPGARNIFSLMQNALSTQSKNRIALGKGVHDALNDFHWMQASISSQPTRIAELVPLPPVAAGHHDASGKGAGGIWFQGTQLTPRVGYTSSFPLVWQHEWPPHITSRLVTDTNPSGCTTNSDLELAGGLLHLDALAQSFDVRKCTILSQAASDMIILAFFFLLRPGEYTDCDGDPFWLENVQLFIGNTRLTLGTAPECDLLEAIIRRVLYLQLHSAPPTTPLARVFNTPDKVTASYLTVQIRDAIAACGPHLGFLPTEVSARCLRAAGVTALLLARVDPDVICLIGRWRSDEMLRYLHVQAYPLMRDYAQRMLSAGTYTLIPNHLVPQR
ncbi:hypothetical protein ACHAXA_011717 [Cyclostephanos tholiformis]|uniref:Reverse transcriptase domain-containing protein n=1 Tax=Cyclostephanos tholiformis TaxID=382380 RepID=A0ABD3RZF5_9STRA